MFFWLVQPDMRCHLPNKEGYMLIAGPFVPLE